MTPTVLDRIRNETFIQHVEFHRELPSTNDLALQHARDSACQLPLLVWAAIQTAGRGRGDNHWWSSSGALTISLLLETVAAHLPAERWPFVSLTVGLAVCVALEKLAADHDVRLKWPNDVYVDGRKICGVLIEVPPVKPKRLVVGIGLNVNNSMADAPAELQSMAASLCDAGGRSFSLDGVLVGILLELEKHLGWIGERDEELRTQWRRRCLLTGESVGVTFGTRSIVGRCKGIDDNGALVLETASGKERCFAGVVTRLVNES